MKLIIEISEEDYKRCTVMASAIRNGILVDDVKAEIQAKEMVETDVERQFYNMALADAIQILDNIGKSESEVKPNEM